MNTMKTQHVLASAAVLLGSLSLTNCSDLTYGEVTTGYGRYRPGYVVNTLPAGYRTVTIGGSRYYHHDNVYYRPRGSSYVVVDRPHYGPYGDRDHDSIPNRYDRRYDGHGRGDVNVVRTLPRGYRVVNHRGERYYRSGDGWYRTHAHGYVRVSAPY
jgi:hypothetical protein